VSERSRTLCVRLVRLDLLAKVPRYASAALMAESVRNRPSRIARMEHARCHVPLRRDIVGLFGTMVPWRLGIAAERPFRR
jgi:hypothetical protein